MKRIFIFCFILFCWTPAKSQNKLIDSLTLALDKTQIDSVRVEIMCALSFNCSITSMPKKGQEYAEKALQLSEKIKYLKGIGNSYHLQGLAQVNQDNHEKGVQFYLKALKLREKANNRKGIAATYNNLGIVMMYQKNYELALQYHQKSLKIRAELKDKNGLSSSYFNIGEITRILAENENNKEKCAEALVYLEKCLAVAKEIDKKYDIANALSGIASAYYFKEEYPKSLDFNLQALKIAREVDNVSNEIGIILNIAQIHRKLKRFDIAKNYLDTAFQTSIKHKNLEREVITYEGYKELYEQTGEYKKAFEYQQKMINLRDSLFTLDKNKQLLELQTQYESDKKETENQLLRQKAKLDSATIQRQFAFGLGGVITLLALLALAIVLYRNNQQKQKVNSLLNEQKQEILSQNEELHQQQEEIMAQRDSIISQNGVLNIQHKQIRQSIRAAKVIQEAILPFENRMNNTLNEHFVLFFPKDIVSGDFYWMQKVDNYYYLIVADCTGHGVPGAFMSMIGVTLLDKIILLENISEPAQILTQMHIQTKLALKQDELSNQNGMDMAVCRWEYKMPDIANVSFAGARRPLLYWDFEKQMLETVNGTKKSIGGHQDETKEFIGNTFEIPKGTSFYLSTDGYADQCDAKRKKFGKNRFINLLTENVAKPLSIQKQIFAQAIQDYQGNVEQRDDILLIGVKI